MLKKLCASLLALLILATLSISAYAGQTDVGNTTQPFSSGVLVPGTGSGIKIAPTSKSAIDTAKTSESAITSESAVTTTSESAIENKSEKKPGFEEVFDGVLKDGTAVSNEYFVMTITNPQKDRESTTYKTYILSGNSKYDDVVISIAKYNEDKREYEPMTNTDGESSWEIGAFREHYLFSKEIQLTDGPNKIKMIAYRKSQKEEALKENIQVNCFTISFLRPSLFTKTTNTLIQAAETLFGSKSNKK